MFREPQTSATTGSFSYALQRFATNFSYKKRADALNLRTADNSGGKKLEHALGAEGIISPYSLMQPLNNELSFMAAPETPTEEEPNQEDIGSNRKNKAFQKFAQEFMDSNRRSGITKISSSLICSKDSYHQSSDTSYFAGNFASQSEAFLRQNNSLMIQSLSSFNYTPASNNGFSQEDMMPIPLASSIIDVSFSRKV